MFSWDLMTVNEASTLDTRQLRQALGSYPTGVCVVTTMTPDGKREGMTINSFASVSLNPPLVLWSIRDDARSVDAFVSTRGFAINTLAVHHRELALHFARPAPDKFTSKEHLFKAGLRDVPVLKDALVSYECTTFSRHTEGDHTVLIGRVDRFEHRAGLPLLFHAGQLGTFQELAVKMHPTGVVP